MIYSSSHYRFFEQIEFYDRRQDWKFAMWDVNDYRPGRFQVCDTMVMPTRPRPRWQRRSQKPKWHKQGLIV